MVMFWSNVTLKFRKGKVLPFLMDGMLQRTLHMSALVAPFEGVLVFSGQLVHLSFPGSVV